MCRRGGSPDAAWLPDFAPTIKERPEALMKRAFRESSGSDIGHEKRGLE
jgi:hypothetical protein